MARHIRPVSIPAERRRELLSALPFLADLPAEALRELADSARDVSYPRGALIAQEGSDGDAVSVIDVGWVQVTAAHGDGLLLLGTLGRGEVFGEMSLIDPLGRRAATVSSLTELDVLTVPRDAILTLLEQHSGVRAALERTREEVLLTNFLKKTTLFAHLDSRQLRRLSAIVEHVAVEAGEDIVRQGEHGDLCFVLRIGRAEARLNTGDGGEHSIAVLGPGALIGEGALLLDAPRSATVRAIDRCELLALRRSVLLRLMSESRDTALDVLDLVHERRPVSQEAVDVRRDVAAAVPPVGLHRRLHRLALGLLGQQMSLDQLLNAATREVAAYPQLGTGYDLEDVRSHMGRLVEYWETTRDRRCIFLRCYWHMTGSMVEALHADLFHDPAWVRELLERFADYYYQALLLRERGSPHIPDVWKAAFQLAETPWITVAEHLLLGVNAHINRDLPFVLADMLTDTWAGLDVDGRRQRQEDYSAVNTIIAEAADAVVDDVLARYDPLIALISRVSRPVGRAAGRSAARFIVSWRDEVWHLGIQLVEETDPNERDGLLQNIERRALNRVKPVISTAELRSYLLAGNAPVNRSVRDAL